MRTGVKLLLCVGALLTVNTATRGQTDASRAAELPRVVLVGDSIRLGYAPRVAERLSGKAVVISSAENGGDSANVLAHLDESVLRHKPDVVHLNCGLHDLKRSTPTGHQVELDRYARTPSDRHSASRRDRRHTGLADDSILDERHVEVWTSTGLRPTCKSTMSQPPRSWTRWACRMSTGWSSREIRSDARPRRGPIAPLPA